MMMRLSIVIALVLGMACAAFAEDKDPIKEKLFATKVAYDKEMRQIRKQIDEWFDKSEDSARKAGDKKKVDQLKEDRRAYEENGDLPKNMPTILQQRQSQAKKKLEAAYTEAIKAYTRAKKDDLASAVEKEWEEVSGKGGINLLALVKVKEHSVTGDWKNNKTSLVCASFENGFSVLQFPYEPGEEYDVEVTIRRLEGEGGFGFGLVAGGKLVSAVVDGWFPGLGYRTGVELVDKKTIVNNATTIKGAVLKSDKDNTIRCSVRDEKIEIWVNGKLTTSFQGKFDRLSRYAVYSVRNEKQIVFYVGTKTSFQIDRAILTPVKGKGTIVKE